MALDAGTVNAKIRVDTATLRADLTQANSAFSTFGQQMNVTALGMAKTWVTAFTGVGAAIGAVIAVANGFKQAIVTFADFEQSMANVASVSKASAEDFERLKAAAEEAGAATRFSASEAADALYYLASAGFTATQSVDALNGVLMLAGATQSDLASTSETVASTISQFGLEAEDAGRVANVFTAAITNSQATMDKLATSMRYVGPVAAAFGYSLESVTGLLQILYNNGYDASQAGTALRSTFADLSNSASPAIAKLNELGVSFESVNPATNSFTDILGALAEAGLTTADVMAVFGDRAGPAMITLLGAGTDAINQYTEAVTGTNAAAVAYARQNDSLLGKVDELTSAAEGLAITFGEQLGPFLRDVVEIGTGFILFLTEAIPYLGTFLGSILSPISALADLGSGMLNVQDAADRFRVGMTEANEILASTNNSIADVQRFREQARVINDLSDEYDTLSAKSVLTKEEQEKLDGVVKTLAETVPEATTAFDKYGNAMEINTETARAYSLSLLDNAETIARTTLDSLKAQRELASARSRDFEAERTEAKRRYDESTARLKKMEGTYRSVLAIETTLAAETADAVDEFGEIDQQKLTSAYRKATQAMKELGLIGATEMDRLDEGAKGLAEVWQISSGSILGEYRQLLGTSEKLFQTWKKFDDSARESDKLIQDIAAAEAELASIQAKKNAITEEGTKKTKEELEAEQKAADEEARKDKEEAERKRQKDKDDEDRKIIEKEWHKKRLEQSGERMALLDLEEKEAIAQAEKVGAKTTDIVDYYAKERKKILDEEKKENKKKDDDETQKMKDAFEERLDEAKKWYSAVSDLAVDFFSALADLRVADIENEIEALDAKTEAQLAQLEAAHQAELEAAGVGEQTALEKAQAELAAAVAANNAEKISEAQLAVTKAQIDAKYEAQKSALEEESARKKAKLEYQAALATWESRKLSAAAQIPMMIMTAVGSGWQAPWPYSPAFAAAFGIAAGATGASQLAAVAASKPEKPSFSTGGIVIGPSGNDNIEANLTAGEIVMNAKQQARLMSILNGEAAGVGQSGGNFTIILEDLGLPLAKATGPWFANNTVRYRPT